MDDQPLAKPPMPDWATIKPPIEPAVEPTLPAAPPEPEPNPPPPLPQPPSFAPPKAGPPTTGIRSSILKTLIKVVLGIIVIALVVFLGFKFFTFIKERRSPSPSKTTTLVYWGLWEDKNIMSSVIADFEKEHPDIKIDYQKRDIKQYRETLKARLLQGQDLDIFRFHNSWLAMFKDNLLPLPKEVIGENPQKLFYPVVEKDLAVNGAYFGLPLEIDTLALFTNSDLLKSAGVTPPKNWNELKSTALRLTVKDAKGNIKQSGVAMGTYDNIAHASDIISLLFLQNGGDFKNLTKTSANFSEALTFYTSFAKNEAAVWSETLDPSLLAFAKGNLAMFFGYSWDVFTIKALNPNLKFEIAAVPQLSENQKVNLASYWVEGVSQKSKNQKAAFAFLAYLAKKETLQKLYSQTAKIRLFGEPYAQVDLGQTLIDNPYLQANITQAKTAVSTPFAADTFDNGLNFELNQYLGDAVRAVAGNTSADSAVETLIKGATAVFTKYGIR